MSKVLQTLRRIPLFADTNPESFAIERLGGLTNLNHKVSVGGKTYMLRIAGEGTGEYIDRGSEEINARVAARAGVNAEVLFFDASDGVQLTRFIDGAATMNPETFKDLGAVARAGRALRQIHDCGEMFATEFNIFRMMDEYLAILNGKDAWIPDGYAHVQAAAESVRAALAANPAPLAPCHCDPLAENFLDSGERMYVVDWEYAGNNDPMWDLADLSVEAAFGADQDTALLQAYFAGSPDAAQLGRMVMYKAMCDLLWTLWGALQVANDNPAEDFTAYAQDRFERCKRLMSLTEFTTHMAAVEKK
mgnify:CR=1 FL=1